MTQTGNIFTLLGVVDPDGDPLRITHWNKPGIGKVGMDHVNGTGDFSPIGGEADTVLNIMPNGDFSFDPASAKTGRFGPQQCSVTIDYTDDKAGDHTTDPAPDQQDQIVAFTFDGDLASNSAPGAITGSITYTPDP